MLTEVWMSISRYSRIFFTNSRGWTGAPEQIRSMAASKRITTPVRPIPAEQCTMIGIWLSLLISRRCSTKEIRSEVCWGMPWSGQLMNCRWVTQRTSLLFSNTSPGRIRRRLEEWLRRSVDSPMATREIFNVRCAVTESLWNHKWMLIMRWSDGNNRVQQSMHVCNTHKMVSEWIASWWRAPSYLLSILSPSGCSRKLISHKLEPLPSLEFWQEYT